VSWTRPGLEQAAGLTSATAFGALHQSQPGPAAGYAPGLLSSAAPPALPLPALPFLLTLCMASTFEDMC